MQGLIPRAELKGIRLFSRFSKRNCRRRAGAEGARGKRTDRQVAVTSARTGLRRG
jgi:hypothetical protein